MLFSCGLYVLLALQPGHLLSLSQLTVANPVLLPSPTPHHSAPVLRHSRPCIFKSSSPFQSPSDYSSTRYFKASSSLFPRPAPQPAPLPVLTPSSIPENMQHRHAQLRTNASLSSKPDKPQPHKQHWVLHEHRKKQILTEHPEIRTLYGTEWRTQFYAYLCILIQFTLCWLCRESYRRAVFFGVFVGPYINACILCLMHEATHMLVFKKPAYNRLLSIAANIPMVVPISEILRQHHSRHHRGLGSLQHDVDVPSHIEVAFVGNRPVRKALWLMFNMVILPIRSVSRLPVIVDKFLVLNWVVGWGFGVFAMIYSRSTFLFLFLSFLNSQGLHPANTRQVQRHIYNGDEKMRTSEERPATYSYYGFHNMFTLNVGYHLEHHDFSCIPWTRLPDLRRIAGKKWYPDESAYQGRGIIELINFVTNPNISLADFASGNRCAVMVFFLVGILFAIVTYPDIENGVDSEHRQ